MGKIVIGLICLLVLTASSNANIMSDVLQALGDLQNQLSESTLENCLQDHVNDDNKRSCDKCKEGYMRSCWNKPAFTDVNICQCKVPNPPNCETLDAKAGKCSQCFDGYDRDCHPITPDSTTYVCDCVKKN